MRASTILAALALVASPAAAQAEGGALVIVGGGLDPANAAVHRAFLDARPPAAPTIVIIPAASGEPVAAARGFRAALVAHGARPEDIEIARIAMVDDPATPDADEAGWAGNVAAAEELDRIRRAGAIWFTGGDQSRITDLLLAPDGSDTPLLAAIRARHAAGAVIGGTSAGAAIMSVPMITGGDTLGALLPAGAGEPLGLGRGLGFLRGALVDQHFGERARLGRLAAALVALRPATALGLGIDEDTALVVAGGQRSAAVVGSGYVTLLDARAATPGQGARFAVRGLVLGLAADGDRITLPGAVVEPAPYRQATAGREYFDAPAPAAGGMAVPGGTLAEVIGEGLVDNAATSEVLRHSFAGAAGVTYRFTQTPATRGAWGRDAAGRARYSLSGVAFAIEPIAVTIRALEE